MDRREREGAPVAGEGQGSRLRRSPVESWVSRDRSEVPICRALDADFWVAIEWLLWLLEKMMLRGEGYFWFFVIGRIWVMKRNGFGIVVIGVFGMLFVDGEFFLQENMIVAFVIPFVFMIRCCYSEFDIEQDLCLRLHFLSFLGTFSFDIIWSFQIAINGENREENHGKKRVGMPKME
ncbi:hypothetical protein RJT34_22849 [Clitoria ternatea]|uniref:Uncharacterized protein n=1 Tax=Clitoria ternatea TaxID=43366 RepID=A0AAN9FN08_CLITE